jgi:HD-GYP domain-containing protein (c-di-GMP phosphodiesterase class II)
VATAIGVAVLLGPVAATLRLPGGTEDVLAWASRGLMFVVVGLAVGVLFDRLSRAVGSLEAAAIEITERQRQGMVALARGAEARDHATGEHIFRCRALATALALETGVARGLADDIGWAAMLHDIGKLHIPDRILLKPGPLTSEEWEVMRRHPVWGEQILEGGMGFEVARRIARWHHEDVDGRGYPDGLKGDAIPLEARIVRVADAYDAMTHDRPYKPAAPPEWALDELRRFAGSQFDRELVQLFCTLLERDERLRMADGVRVRVLDLAVPERRAASGAGGGREIL